MTHHMLKRVEIIGFKSFAKKTIFDFSSSVTSIVGPNGSGKSNITEAFRFALGEQSMKNMRGKRSEDLIFNGSPTAPRTNRAAVAIIFDNTSRAFTIDFDEVRVERTVLRDGTSEYTINDSKVRLRDIHELLSHANIGESGHHIIAQGEADRIFESLIVYSLEQSMKNMRGKRSEDLIFNGSPTAPRTNRAAVAIIFDNTSRAFTIDFDEVRVERTVLRDGTSEYTINDSKVRLRDIHELLSHANIGESGHHIIAQGEADRILLANARQRREMLEDALGLASYEFKKLEAQRKLERTRENIKQVEALRRELSPHVNFLKKQIEKLERADATRDELSALSVRYFAIEDVYLTKEEQVAICTLAQLKETFLILSVASYEFKKLEAQRKLERTRENIKQVEALRRELSPHVNFLKKQIEKLERADATRDELSALSVRYFAIEDVYLTKEEQVAICTLAQLKETFLILSAQLSEISATSDKDDESERLTHAVRTAENAFEQAMATHSVSAREVSKTEGALEAMQERKKSLGDDPYVRIARDDISALCKEVQTQATEALDGDVSKLRATLVSVRTMVKSFFERFGSVKEMLLSDDEQKLHMLEHQKMAQEQKEEVLANEVEKARNAVLRVREMYSAQQEAGREGQRRSIALAQQEAHAQTSVAQQEAQLREISMRSERCERDKAELLALVGPSAVSYEPRTEVSQEEYSKQDDRRRSIERFKIRLEELGGTGEDIRAEYKEVSGREDFLEKELGDLSHSANVLLTLIDEIDADVAKSFAQGLARVNESFGTFFSLMFGGGSAHLVLEEDTISDDDEEDRGSFDGSVEYRKPGVEVVVHIPQKRVQSLLQLSGGERALASIALIFAMSQVNPPPFLILDETDAALDEANSRRYGDMIENLSKKSQLIVITHNRETMSRADILYGVTMRGDGTSKLLSVKFDDAVTVAKR